MRSLLNRVLHKLAFVCPGGYTIRPSLQRWRGAHIGRNAWISQYVYLDELYPEGVYIGENSTIGLRCSIFTHFYWGPRRREGGVHEVHIGKNAFIGPHCVILPGVTVGEGAVIQAGCVVSRCVPPRTLWGLPPAGPLAEVTVPLTPQYSYEQYLWGIRPLAGSNDLKPETEA
jgi:acetyltransferase-like isoleucine patch superfamily enzyme